MSEEIIYREVTIKLSDGIRPDDPIIDIAKTYIDMRFRYPIMLDKKDSYSRSMRTSSEEERKMAGEGNIPQLTVQLADCEGTIILPYGTKLEDVTPEDIVTAKMLWYDEVLIDKTDEGEPWVDIIF